MSNYTRTPRASRRNKKAGIRRTLLVVCMMLVVMVGSIAGTVAWLTATSGEVTNTFTIGDITIELLEHKLLEDGTLSATETVTEQAYTIVPGGTYNKDPFVTVGKDSEDCYIYISVENNLGIASWDVNEGWTLVGKKDNEYVYRYNETVSAEESTPSVFSTVKINSDVTKESFTEIGTKTIVLNAFAHQSANTDTDTADKAAIAHFGVDAVTSSN